MNLSRIKSNHTLVKARKLGLTAVEVSAAIAIGILFVAAATFGVLRQIDNSRYSTFTNLLGSDLAGAVTNVYSTTGTLTSLTADATGKSVLTGMGVTPNTPWNTAWTVSAAGTANTVGITFPAGGSQSNTKMPGIATTLGTQYPIISAATYTAGTTGAAGNLVVTYNVLR